MKYTYEEPKITIVELSKEDILLFSSTKLGPGNPNSFTWEDLLDLK